MKNFVPIFIACLCSTVSLRGQEDPALPYIAKWSEMAVSEMYRSGVPASITLAQGMLESNNGRSRLATEANNHFGIKCHSDWRGATVHHDDDAKGECFRKYDKAETSYKDHSDFLRFKPRYAFLFDLETKDYKGWAAGLSKAGYATDPAYASKLVRTIEKYDLTRFDSAVPVSAGEVQKESLAIPESPTAAETPVRMSGRTATDKFSVVLEREVLSINGVPFIYARQGETLRSIARRYDLFVKEILSFNDTSSPDAPLNAGERVYIARKQSKAAKGLDKHICSDGQSLRGISQQYAVKMSALMKYNGIDNPDVVLREDDTVLLRGKIKR